MNRKLNLVAGQEVIIRYIGKYEKDLNTIADWTTPAVVEKVGKKLITVKSEDDEIIKFEIEEDYRKKSAGASNYKLYESIEAIKEEVTNHNMHSDIKDKFSQLNEYPFTIDQLKRIMSIINE